jgi:hypothetical protein
METTPSGKLVFSLLLKDSLVEYRISFQILKAFSHFLFALVWQFKNSKAILIALCFVFSRDRVCCVPPPSLILANPSSSRPSTEITGIYYRTWLDSQFFFYRDFQKLIFISEI